LEQEASKSKRAKRAKGTVAKPLPNPGKFEEHCKECKEVLMADVFPGARFEMNWTPVT
jgi:hypothetical protein